MGLILVAGKVLPNMVRIEGRELQMIMTTQESLGNCPKVFCLAIIADLVHYRTGYGI
jgi:hypothetical protein